MVFFFAFFIFLFLQFIFVLLLFVVFDMLALCAVILPTVTVFLAGALRHRGPNGGSGHGYLSQRRRWVSPVVRLWQQFTVCIGLWKQFVICLGIRECQFGQQLATTGQSETGTVRRTKPKCGWNQVGTGRHAA